MAEQPTEKLTWAVNDVDDPVTGAPNKREPTSEFKNEGLKREEPLFRDHVNWAFNNIGKWIDYLDTVNSTITVDTTIYVATTGDDVTGDGTVLSPFASPHRALDSLIGVPIATTTLVTILCAAGSYNFTSPIIVNHPYGERIHITGDTLTGVKPFGVPAVDWSSDRNNPVVTPRASDEYYNTSGSQGANASYANRLTALQSDLINNKVLINSRFATVFNFQDSSGFQVQGNNSLGKIDKVAIIGDWSGSDADIEEYYGIDSGESLTGVVGTPANVSGGTVFVGSDVVVAGFRGDGFRARYGGVIACEEGVVSVNNLEKGFNTSFFSSIVANNSMAIGNIDHGYLSISTSMLRAENSISSGNLASGAQASTGSSIRGRSSSYNGNRLNGLSLSIGSFGSIDSISCRGNGGVGTRAAVGSGGDMDTCTLSDNNIHGLEITGATIIGTSLTIENNGDKGLSANSGASIALDSSIIQLNGGEEISIKASNLSIISATIPSGSLVTAANNSYIDIPNIAGVTYSPSYGVVGNNEALISS